MTYADVTACCRVLDALAANMQIVSASPRLKGLRKSLGPFVEAEGAKRFGGASREDNDARRRAAQDSNRSQQQAKARDRKFIENTLLRQGRRAKLDALKSQCDDDRLLLLVPDGLGAQLPPACERSLPAPAAEDHADSSAVGDDDAGAIMVGRCGGQPTPPALDYPRACYTCKIRFTQLHFFYDQLCPTCAELNYRKRQQTADLSGKVAVLTGARVKIGFRAALKLLRCGATLVATTRFPRDAAERFAQEDDYASWASRLHVVGLDLRDLPALEHFTGFLARRFGQLDIIINNACQTVRRPRGYYKPQVEREVVLEGGAGSGAGAAVLALHNEIARDWDGSHLGLLQDEHASADALAHLPPSRSSAAAPDDPAVRADGGAAGVGAVGRGGQVAGAARSGGGIARSAALATVALTVEDQTCGEEAMPSGMCDVNGQQVDLRTHNSWLLKMHEVSTPELLEVMTINAVAPFTLNSRLLPLMLASGGGEPKFIVNVSAMEGKFYRYKTPHHPHTNMAKAALNMMTRTAAEDLHAKGIYMTAVDTGWINDENPVHKASRYAAEAGFQTPIDEEDAAARILDPVMLGCGAEGAVKLIYGQFLKDYAPTEW